MTLTIENESWQTIAQQASKEMDSTKLMVLVAKLCVALDDRHEAKPRLLAPRVDAPGYGFAD